MRSIRRSLLGYLLLLLAVALGAVGLLVDRFAIGAIRQREGSEEDRIEQAFKLRQREAKTKFDADLMTESKAMAREVHSHTRSLVGQDPRPRPGPGGPTAKLPELPAAPPTLKAPKEEAWQFSLRVALLELAPGPHLLPAVTPVAAVEPMVRGNEWRRHYPYPGWAEFDGPRALARIQEALRKEFAEERPPHQYQFTLVGSSRGVRNVLTVRSERLSDDLPEDAAMLEPAAESEPKIEDVDVPGLGRCRRVATSTLASGRSLMFWIVLPSPAVPPPPPAVPQPPLLKAIERYPQYPPFRGADMTLRVIVHVVRPYSELEARLAVDQKERDEQLDRVREETRMELAQFRWRLTLIGSGTFAALVLGGWFFVARGLSPLRKLSDAVSQVSEKDFRLPVEAAELGRELAPIHARLTQTLTLLQRAFEREKQAVADISHELRTPIASLLATIDVSLRKPRTPEQYRTTLEECRLISRQLGQLVERIMTLASLDAGNDRMLVAAIDLADLIGGCAAVIRPLAAANNLTLSVRQDDDLTLESDAGKLREVLMNLLHNAVEYNTPGGRIELTARRDGAFAVFEVRDTGIGIPDDMREKIFERFYRADASRHATGVHAGLGLSIVREYVSRLNGTIAVESAPGAGTTFRVTLPATSDSPPAPPSTSDRAKARDAVVPAGS